MDWAQNERGQSCLAVEDDASRKVLAMIEDESCSAGRSVSLLDEIQENYASQGEILEVITDHGSEFVNTHQNERPCLDHEFERYLDDNDIINSLCKVGWPQSNRKIERFFQTRDKQRWRFGLLTSSQLLQPRATTHEPQLGQS